MSQSADESESDSMDPVVQKLINGERVSERVAWCARTGITAVPLPVLDALSPLSILLSYPDPEHEASWTLQLPPTSSIQGTREIVSLLSFSPNGDLLLVATTSRSATTYGSALDAYAASIPVQGKPLRLVVFQMQACVNQWLPIIDWNYGKARPEGPRCSGIVALRWLSQSNPYTRSPSVLGKRKATGMDEADQSSSPQVSQYGKDAFVAVLDTQECLVFTRTSDQAPRFTMGSLAGQGGTSSEDLLPAGSASQTGSVDPFSNVMADLPATAASKMSKRCIQHAAVSEAVRMTTTETQSGSATSFLVAYTSRPSPGYHSSAAAGSSLLSSAGATQIDPVSGSSLLDSVRVDSMGNLQLPSAVGEPPTNLFGVGSEQPALGAKAQPPTTSSLGLLQSDGVSGLMPPNQPAPSDNSFLGGLTLPMSYGDEINMSTLDEMFDSDFGSSNTFGSGLFGLDAPAQTDATTQAVDESKLAVASPSKSVGSNAGSSPQKSTSGIPGGGPDESPIPRQIPEMLNGQPQVDEEAGRIDIWSVALLWDTPGKLRLPRVQVKALTDLLPLAVATNHVKTIALSDPLCESLENGAVLDKHVTCMSWVESPRRPTNALSEPVRLRAAMLCPSHSGSTPHKTVQDSWTLYGQPFELSDAFASLEGRKADPPAPPLHGTEWVILSEDRVPDLEDAVTVGYLDDGGAARLVYRTDRRTYEYSSPDRPALAIASQDSLAMVPSPNGISALACAFSDIDDAEMMGRPAIFPLSDITAGRDVDLGLSQAAASAILLRQSLVDVTHMVTQLASNDRESVLKRCWAQLGEMLPGIRVEQSPYVLSLLSLQHRLLPNGHIAYAIVQLAAMQRVLQSSRTVLRNAAGQQQMPLDVFEISSIWPIIGHIRWLFKLWDSLIARIADKDAESDWSSCVFLVMHPLPRTIQQQIIRLMARFTAFVMSPKEAQVNYLFGGAAALDIEIARHVLGDLVFSNRIKTQEWGSMLSGLAKSLGEVWSTSSSGTQAESTEALISLTLPDALQSKARDTINGVREKLLPLIDKNAPSSPLKGPMDLDIVTKATLVAGKPTRRCLVCNVRAALPVGAAESEWEIARQQSCICGGRWVAQ